jgi:ABC-2 type transport system permease protein
VLHLAKHHITEPTTTLQLVVDAPPERAGIDPYNKLVDRISGDNVASVEKGAAPVTLASGGS